MSDTLTSDQKIEEKIKEAKEEIKNGVDNINDAVAKAMELISFEVIGEEIAKSMGESPIPPGTPGLPQVMRKTAMEMLGGKEKLINSGLTELQINEKIIEMIANIGFVALSLASIASGNIIPSPPSIAVAKKYYDIISSLMVFAESEVAASQIGQDAASQIGQEEEEGQVNERTSIL